MSNKPNRKNLASVILKNHQVHTKQGAAAVFTQGDGKHESMYADLVARTVNIKIKGNGTTVIPFEHVGEMKYAMGVAPKDE